MSEKNPVILYHADCPDGFGGAYAAWKKFGDAAEYVPVKHGQPAPNKLNGRDIILIDFTYQKPVMDELAGAARSVTVIDHHEGVREAATSFPGVFDTTHSGAVLAWTYFHPDTEVPKLLLYVEDGDLYRFALPHAREILAYAYFDPFTFAHWDTLREELESESGFEHALALGEIFNRYHARLVTLGVHHADLVQFEGYECYLASAFGEFTSDVGNQLVQRKPPLAVLVSVSATGIKVSMRSDASVDVAAIARKYGGNGHPQAAGFRLAFGDPIPWKVLEKDHESTGH